MITDNKIKVEALKAQPSDCSSKVKKDLTNGTGGWQTEGGN
jgi:hypothetical protein